MLLTEKEAAGKWCRFSRVDVVLPPAAVELGKGSTLLHQGVNRVENAQTGQARLVGMCVGSKCMAWRWAGRDDGDAIATGEGHIPKSEAKGYCGDSGVPYGAP